MDTVLACKDNYMKIAHSQIKDLLQKQAKLMDDVKHKRSQHSNEDEIKIEKLSSEATSLKETLQYDKQALEYKNQLLEKHLEHIGKLEEERTKCLEENQTLELQKYKLKVCKRNLQDQKILDQGRKMISLYRELTGIKWDYERIKENVVGYVKHKKKYIHHFCYNIQDTKDLHNTLWQEIYKSTIQGENKEHNKENII